MFGTIFNIQSFSIHDGPGIRDVIFLKGCSLRCQWCSNPESQLAAPELSHNRSRCLGIAQCGACVKACPNGVMQATSENLPNPDRDLCKSCGACVNACPAKAMRMMGTLVSVEELSDRIHKNDSFYVHSEGGVTLGGGEPLFQADFAAELLTRLGKEGVHRAVETAGHVPFDAFEKVCPELDLLIFDQKHSNSAEHKKWTGAGNELILDNLHRVAQAFPSLPILVRTPVIPGVNDAETTITAITETLKPLKSVIKYELLPYHRFGKAKYMQHGREYPFDGPKDVDKNRVASLQKIADTIELMHA